MEFEVEKNEQNGNGTGAGSTSTDSADKGGATGNVDNGGKEPTTRTFTQEDVTRLMTKEKQQGRNAALKELGIDPKDTATVAEVKRLIEERKTDAARAGEQAAAEQAKLAAAEERAMRAEIKAEAALAHAQPQYVDDIVELVLARMRNDEGSDAKTVLNEVKATYAVMFAEPDNAETAKGKDGTVGQRGTGSSVKAVEGAKKEERTGLGARLAASRKAASPTKSYWGKN